YSGDEQESALGSEAGVFHCRSSADRARREASPADSSKHTFFSKACCRGARTRPSRASSDSTNLLRRAQLRSPRERDGRRCRSGSAVLLHDGCREIRAVGIYGALPARDEKLSI